MKLHHLKPAEGSKQRKIRVGRGKLNVFGKHEHDRPGTS